MPGYPFDHRENFGEELHYIRHRHSKPNLRLAACIHRGKTTEMIAPSLSDRW